jgi:hypothetical protein
MSEQLLEQVRDAAEGQIVRSFVTMLHLCANS